MTSPLYNYTGLSNVDIERPFPVQNGIRPIIIDVVVVAVNVSLLIVDDHRITWVIPPK